MKTIFLSIFLAAISYTSFAAAPGNPEEPETVVTDNANAGIYFSLWGSIGDASAEMDMNGMTGHFSYNGINRKLKFGSYNKRSGKLILKEYDLKGRYIGQFVGTYSEFYVPEKGFTCASYNGTFTNTKGGKTTFYLYYD